MIQRSLSATSVSERVRAGWSARTPMTESTRGPNRPNPKRDMMTKYVIAADGACSGNPGPGGWAYAIFENDAIEGNEIAGSAGSATTTTNNIMELTACAEALEEMVQRGTKALIQLRFDSKYVLDGIFEWMPNWKAHGWKTSSGKPVKNVELWQRIDQAIKSLPGATLVPDWVKGHAGDYANELVDTKACEMRDLAKSDAAEPVKSITIPDPVPAGDDITPEQVRRLRPMLDRYAAGEASVEDILTSLRAEVKALGLAS